MKDWARKIVNSYPRAMKTKDGNWSILLLSDRQVRFLHLQRQCYFDCPLCEMEAELFLQQKEEVVQ